MALSYAQKMMNLAHEKQDRVEKEKKIKKKHDKEILIKNCELVGNEIVKLVIKAINDDANDIGNPTKVYWDDQTEVTLKFSGSIIIMLRNMLVNNLSFSIIDEIIQDHYTEAELMYGQRKELFLDLILKNQFKTFGFKFFNKDTIYNINRYSEFNLTLTVIIN